ncbi:hypothetical protein E8E12_010581 [Didymella heteroderae]|uniref:Trehalose synthase N-terminal domain-containing protein n=1 Tax=Didymella heteroderae TaxID=1769908 RepID=A0A9P4WW86_9PLEO|nr:hypothetical protein E8E12_010581 [Didymella heteroderae]
MGIAVAGRDVESLEVGFAAHDGTCSTDFAVFSLSRHPANSFGLVTSTRKQYATLADFILKELRSYQQKHMYKLVGIGLTKRASEIDPRLCSRLWLELDAVPLVFPPGFAYGIVGKLLHNMTVDEEADSMARKATTYFGPTQQPCLIVGFRNEVEVDCAGLACIASLTDYASTVSEATWTLTLKYAESLKRKKTRIAFFSSTPRGEDIASTSHALMRFLHLLGVDTRWYVPKPKPEVSFITSSIRETLCGDLHPDARSDPEPIWILDQWCKQNSEQFWISKGDPLAPRSRGGADLVVVGDVQMASLVRIAKQQDPTRPVVFNCQVQINADLTDQVGTAPFKLWSWLWSHVKDCDIFLHHPVPGGVPRTVTPKKVGYMLATADWLDGSSKCLDDWDSQYYIEELKAKCMKTQAKQFDFPHRPYILQIADAVHASDVPSALAAYSEFRRGYTKNTDTPQIPQLVILSHDALGNCDATSTHDEMLDLLQTRYEEMQDDVVFIRPGIADQTLNALLSTAQVVLQLSSRPGLEVMLNTALRKGVPAISTRAKNTSSYVKHGISGFLVDKGDYKAVARFLHHLFTNHEAYNNMRHHAGVSISSECSTVGNALAWLYIADALSNGEKIQPGCRNINAMAREAAALPYKEGEPCY